MYNAARVFAIAVLAIAAWWSVRLARADHAFRQGTLDGVDRAVQLLPRDAKYLLFQAQQEEYEDRDARALLERAAAASPASSTPRIRLGLDAESRGDFARAESLLLEAARVDRQFEPAWTLANYYFRRGERENFWKWARNALGISYGDRRLLLDLCWQMTNDPEEIFLKTVPREHSAVAAYVSDLVYVHHHPNALKEPAMILGAWHDPDDRQLLLAACNTLLDARRVDDAADVWTSLGESRPTGITHPDFEAPRTGQGFDWRWAETAGVAHSPIEGGHRITFDGKERELCELLRQTVLLHQGKYILRWESRTQGLPSATGLLWNGGGAIASTSDWRPGQAAFTATGEMSDIVLNYRRPSGEPRADGWLELRHVQLVAE